ncbi:hypothetical protein BJ944DRAFT_177764 [Cunninghamella echinulata]|nr:hypothetical protein BJ944DRAFT_177764 [Cunninghamella echinulata]
MLVSNHYSTPPHEEEHSNTQKTMEYESLDPTLRILHPPPNTNSTINNFRSQTSPCHYASPSPSNSRRGSMIDIRSSNNSSPPSSPSSSSTHTLNRPSPLEHRPDLISTPASPLHTPWRRDSLPSISQLTSELHFHPTSTSSSSSSSILTPTSSSSSSRSRHTSSPGHLLLDEVHGRRHSIAIAPSIKRDFPSISSSSSSTSTTSSSLHLSGSLSTCSSPHHQPRFDNYSHITSPPPPPPSLSSSLAIHPTTTTTAPSSSTTPPPPARRYSTHAPYSRSPELRVSHKLAERKRRKEMKDLFDDLREILPVDKGLKTSKWEILSKAVGYINHLHEREENFAKEIEDLRKELMFLKQK